MEIITKDEYLERISRNLVPNSKEIGFYSTPNWELMGIIIQDEDNEFHCIVHKKISDGEYEFYDSKHNLKNYKEAEGELSKLL